MKKTPRTKKTTTAPAQPPDAYTGFAGDIAALLDEARRQAARSVNAILTATYWEIGRRIVEFEQKGAQRAEYGEELLVRLSQDLSAKFKRGFSRQNLQQMRQFYLAYSLENICQTLSGKSEVVQTLRAKLALLGDYLTTLAQAFPLSWSHYVRLLSVRTPEARTFYETEALCPGAPDTPRREPTRWAHSLLGTWHCSGALCAGQYAEQHHGGRISSGSTQPQGFRRGDREDESYAAITCERG